MWEESSGKALYHCPESLWFVSRPPLKKLFPVQRVTKIVASRAAANYYFFFFFSMVSFLSKK